MTRCTSAARSRASACRAAIDLRDIAFGSGTTLGFTEAGDNLSGTLTVSDGTNTANITLLGQYVAGNFTKQSDGNGGTLITDPPVQSLTGGVFLPALLVLLRLGFH